MPYYDVCMYKSNVAGFIEEVLKQHGEVHDIFIFSLNNPYVKRKEWKMRVEVKEPFEYPGVEWSEPPKCDVRLM